MSAFLSVLFDPVEAGYFLLVNIYLFRELAILQNVQLAAYT